MSVTERLESTDAQLLEAALFRWCGHFQRYGQVTRTKNVKPVSGTKRSATGGSRQKTVPPTRQRTGDAQVRLIQEDY
jgi:hypothetical protein